MKARFTVFLLDNYLLDGSIHQEYADYFRKFMAEERNILISGSIELRGTKFANALIKELLDIVPNDRPIIMEDMLELQCTTAQKRCEENFYSLKSIFRGL